MKEGLEDCVDPGVIYGPIGVPLEKKLVVNTSIHVATEDLGDVCIGPWGIYVPIEVTPGNFSDRIYLALISNYINHIDQPYIYTPTTIITNLKLHVELYSN